MTNQESHERAVEALREQIEEGATLDRKTGCWVWRGAVSRTGVPVMPYSGRIDPVPRLAWRSYVGQVSKETPIDPCPHNSRCVRAGDGHLSIGVKPNAWLRDPVRVAEVEARLLAGEKPTTIAKQLRVSPPTLIALRERAMARMNGVAG